MEPALLRTFVVAKTNPKKDFTLCLFSVSFLGGFAVGVLVCLSKKVSKITIIKIALQL